MVSVSHLCIPVPVHPVTNRNNLELHPQSTPAKDELQDGFGATLMRPIPRAMSQINGLAHSLNQGGMRLMVYIVLGGRIV
jgi:hypothetical protein